MLCVILQLYLSCILLYRTNTDLYLAVSCEQIFTLQHHVNRSLSCSIMRTDLYLVVSCEQIFTLQHHVNRSLPCSIM